MTISPRRHHLGRHLAAVAALALVGGVITVAPAAAEVGSTSVPTAPAGQVALDRFERTATSALGVSDSGGSWSVSQPASASVSGGRGHLALARPGQGVSAYLASAPSTDTDVTLAVSLDLAPSGGGTWVSVVGRRVGNAEYRARVKVAAGGAVTASLARTSAGVETILSNATVALPAYLPGTQLLVRMRLRGTAPTTVLAKVWAKGTVEPAAWLLRTTDATAGLQAAGGTGLFAYLSGSARTPQDVSLDDIDVHTPVVQVRASSSTTTRTAGPVPAAFSFTSNTAGSSFSCSVDAAAFAPCTTPFAAPAVADGTHRLAVRAVDSDGFASPVVTTSWAVDTVAPVVTFPSGPQQGGTLASSIASLTVAASEPASLECRLDAAAWAPCDSGLTVSGLTDGGHTVDARATDGAGNVSTVVTRSWTVDTVAPETTFSSGAAGGTTTSTSATFALGASENATFACRLDAAAWVPCTSPVAYSGLAVGPHTVQVVARDAAGNVDATPASTTWTIVSPVAAVAAPAPAPVPAPPVGAVQPGASNTGVPAGTILKRYDGDLTITTPGTVIDGMDIHGFVTIKANDVTIRRSIVRGGVAAITAGNRSLITSTYPGAVIEDTELAPEFPSVRIDGLKGYGFTARRLNIHDAVDNTLIWGNNTTLESSWLHDNRHYAVDPNQGGTPSHDDSVQVQGGTNIRIAGNTLTGAYGAAIQVTQDYTLTTALSITDNWLGNGGCSVNVAEKGKGPLQNLILASNKFFRTSTYKCPAIIPTTTTVANTANTYTDNGATITLIRN